MDDTLGVGRRGAVAGKSFAVMTALIFTLFAVAFPERVMGAASLAAERFVKGALPSVLLFSVASGMMVRGGMGEICKGLFGGIFKRIFGISGSLAAPFILGAVAGFPIGARTVCELYGRGECTKREAEVSLALCSNPGLGFTVAGVGGIMWGDIGFGLTAWGICLLSSVIVGMLKKGKDTVNSKDSGYFGYHEGRNDAADFSVSATVSESVADGAFAALRVFAFVVLFSAVSAVFQGFTAWLPFAHAENTEWLKAVTVSFFEFSSGVFAIAEASFPSVALPSFLYIGGEALARAFTVAALSWSGVSVHMQAAGFTAPFGISMREYYLRKAAAVLLSFLLYTFLSVVTHGR